MDAAKKALAGYGLFWSAVDEMEGPKAFQAGTAPTLYAKGRADLMKGTALDPMTQHAFRMRLHVWFSAVAAIAGLTAVGIQVAPQLEPTPAYEIVRNRAITFQTSTDSVVETTEDNYRTIELRPREPSSRDPQQARPGMPNGELASRMGLNLESLTGKLRVNYYLAESIDEAKRLHGTMGIFGVGTKRRGKALITATGDKAQEFLKGL